MVGWWGVGCCWQCVPFSIHADHCVRAALARAHPIEERVDHAAPTVTDNLPSVPLSPPAAAIFSAVAIVATVAVFSAVAAVITIAGAVAAVTTAVIRGGVEDAPCVGVESQREQAQYGHLLELLAGSHAQSTRAAHARSARA